MSVMVTQITENSESESESGSPCEHKQYEIWVSLGKAVVGTRGPSQ